MSVNALIFDVDGTMADTEEAHRVAFNLAFERCRLDWNWDRAAYRELLKVHGGKERLTAYIDRLDLSPVEQAALRARVPAIHMEKTKLYSAVVRDGAVPLREGVARLCDEARSAGCRLAIASTTTAVNVDALLRSALGASGPALFSAIACGDEVRAKKPAPDIYRLALRKLGQDAERAVAIEDSMHGLRAATSATLWTVVTPTYWTEDDDFRGADLVLPGLGGPAHPLTDEPGRRLRDAAWLTFRELDERVTQRKPQRAALKTPLAAADAAGITPASTG